MRRARRPPWCAGRRNRNGRPGGTPPPRRRSKRLGRQRADRLRDVRKPAGEISPEATPHLDALALLSGESSKAVVFHLVPPARPGGRIGDEGRPTGLDETGRRQGGANGPERCHGMPLYVGRPEGGARRQAAAAKSCEGGRSTNPIARNAPAISPILDRKPLGADGLPLGGRAGETKDDASSSSIALAEIRHPTRTSPTSTKGRAFAARRATT